MRAKFTSMMAALLLVSWPAQGADYGWLGGRVAASSLAARIAPPPGFKRLPAAPGGFGDWLRHLPLKAPGTKVRLHDGRLKGNQGAHVAVIDIDVGRGDLQQCADAVMRLRAEYLYARDRTDEIAFNFTSGDRASFGSWSQGWRPRVSGRRVRWRRTARPDASRKSLGSYLRSVFLYAGTWSLARELPRVADPGELRIGDLFVEGGFPGHAVIIVDMAVDAASGRKIMLLVQSYMPAQDMHVLANPSGRLGPWYELPFGARLRTPEWTFRAEHMRRFP